MAMKSFNRIPALCALAASFALLPVSSLIAVGEPVGTTTISKVSTVAGDNVDAGAVNSQVTNLGCALSNSDASTTAGFWAEDGEYIDRDGNKVQGKSTLEKHFTDLYSVQGKRQVQLVPESTRLLSPEAAYSEGKVLVGDLKVPETRYLIVFTKQNGKWLIQTATEIPLEGSIEDKPSSLSDLSWLIGTWEAKRPEASISMKATWDGDKHLIMCRYEIKRENQPTDVDIQIIGYNSAAQQPVGWHFNSDGTYGFAKWYHENERWIIEANGAESDGTSSKATNLLEEIKPDSFTWRSVDRHLGHMRLPDLLPFTITRVSSSADSAK